MHKAHIGLGGAIGIAANGKTNNETCGDESAALSKACEFQCLNNETVDDPLLDDSASEIDPVKVFHDARGSVEIGSTRRIENIQVNVVEQRVRGGEELVRQER